MSAYTYSGNKGKLGSSSSGILNFQWDDFTVDTSAATEDTYTYTLNSVVTGRITIRYSDTCKNQIIGGGSVPI